MTEEACLFAYFGHHKCASEWIVGILRDICQASNLRCVRVSRVEEHKVSELSALVAAQQPDFLAYTNADIRQVRTLDNFRAFHVIRDPRDLIVSAYYSHLHSHPLHTWEALAEHRQRLQAVSKREGLLLEMDYCKRVLAEIGNWDYSQPNVMEVRMEHLTASPYEKMVEILTFLGMTTPQAEISYQGQLLTLCAAALGGLQRTMLRSVRTTRAALSSLSSSAPALALAVGRHAPQPAPAGNFAGFPQARNPRHLPHWLRFRRSQIDLANLLLILYRHRFVAKAAGRERGQEDVQSHYRKGTPNDWINHFEPVHIAYCKSLYNDMLIKLGYEKTDGW